MTLIDKNDSFVFGFSKLDVLFGRTDARSRPSRLPRLREARRALPAGDDHRDRPGGAARHNRHGHLRRRRPGRGARRRLRPRRHAGPRRRRQRVLLRRRRRAAARRAAHVLEGPRDRRRLRGAVQVPAGAERGRVAAPRLPHRARRARRLRDLHRHPVREPGPAVARHVSRAGRGLRRARHRVRPGPPRQRARHLRAASPCSTTAARCPTTCSWASPSTAPPTWSWPAAWPKTATCP